MNGNSFAEKWNSVQCAVKALRENGYVIAAARLVVGLVFLFASIEKISDPNAFAVSISNYRLIGQPLTVVAATVLPWLELLSGLFLIFGILPKGSSLLVLLMLFVFTGGVISGIARGLDISCGCFTRDPNVDTIGWMKVMENIGLMLLSGLVLFGRTHGFGLLSSDHINQSEGKATETVS